MEREELIEFLREHLTVEVSLTDSYESGGRYFTSSVTLRLGDDVLSTDDESIWVSD